jgi:four helix bundle protein
MVAVSAIRNHKRPAVEDGSLYRAVGSVGANITEGYSRHSGKGQARFHEYAYRFGREARTWYFDGHHILTPQVAMHRIRLLASIIRQLLTIIPHERGYRMSEGRAEYVTDGDTHLNDVPLP